MNIADLPKRERQVVDLTLKGYTVQEIADMLGLGKKGIQTAKYRVRDKLGIKSDVQLFAVALRETIRQPGTEWRDVLDMLDEVLP